MLAGRRGRARGGAPVASQRIVSPSCPPSRHRADRRPAPAPLVRRPARTLAARPSRPSASARRPCWSSRRWWRASACSAVPAETPSGRRRRRDLGAHGISVADPRGHRRRLRLAGRDGYRGARDRAGDSRAHDRAHRRADRRSAPTPTATPPATATPEPPGSGGSTAVVSRKALQRRLDAWRAKHFVPGVSVALLWDDGRTWLGASGDADIASRSSGDAPDRFRPRLDLEDLHRGGRPASSSTRASSSWTSGSRRCCPQLGIDRRVTVRMLLDHTQRPERLLLQPEDRPRAAGQPGRHVDREAHVALRAGGPHPAGQGLGLLEHQLPRPGRARPGGRRAAPGEGDPLEAARPARARARVVPGGREAADRAQHAATGSCRDRRAGRAPSRSRRRARSCRSGPSSPPRAARARSPPRPRTPRAGCRRSPAGGCCHPRCRRRCWATSPTPGRSTRRIPYGLGIQQLPIAGRPALGHSGRYLGYRNVVRYLPADGVTIAVLTNQGVVDPAVVAAQLLKIALR